MRLPLLLSVPHAGLSVPPEVKTLCCLTPQQIVTDGDVGACEIYDLRDHVADFVTTDVARAIVDLNRAEDDRRPDGVVKTETCWKEPVYHEFPPEPIIDTLLERYYRPYHILLSTSVPTDVRLCVDCHTMATIGPPVGPDPGVERPHVCLGTGHTAGNAVRLPAAWVRHLVDSFRMVFGDSVTLDKPFAGGYITRSHGRERPWVQFEFSRGPFLSDVEKRDGLLRALTRFCQAAFG